MNDTVYFDDVSPYNIEDEIGFDDEHPVADCRSFSCLGICPRPGCTERLLIRLSSLSVTGSVKSSGLKPQSPMLKNLFSNGVHVFARDDHWITS